MAEIQTIDPRQEFETLQNLRTISPDVAAQAYRELIDFVLGNPTDGNVLGLGAVNDLLLDDPDMEVVYCPLVSNPGAEITTDGAETTFTFTAAETGAEEAAAEIQIDNCQKCLLRLAGRVALQPGICSAIAVSDGDRPTIIAEREK